jgi:hypothetical protein
VQLAIKNQRAQFERDELIQRVRVFQAELRSKGGALEQQRTEIEMLKEVLEERVSAAEGHAGDGGAGKLAAGGAAAGVVRDRAAQDRQRRLVAAAEGGFAPALLDAVKRCAGQATEPHARLPEGPQITTCRLDDAAAPAGEEVHDDQYDSDHEGDVDGSRGDVERGQTKKPGDDDDCTDDCEHLCCLLGRSTLGASVCGACLLAALSACT